MNLKYLEGLCNEAVAAEHTHKQAKKNRRATRKAADLAHRRATDALYAAHAELIATAREAQRFNDEAAYWQHLVLQAHLHAKHIVELSQDTYDREMWRIRTAPPPPIHVLLSDLAAAGIDVSKLGKDELPEALKKKGDG